MSKSSSGMLSRTQVGGAKQTVSFFLYSGNRVKNNRMIRVATESTQQNNHRTGLVKLIYKTSGTCDTTLAHKQQKRFLHRILIQAGFLWALLRRNYTDFEGKEYLHGDCNCNTDEYEGNQCAHAVVEESES